MKQSLRSCYRCGVEFDGADYLPDAPCIDCQMDVSGEYRKLSVVKAAESVRKDVLVTQFWERILSDRQISEAIGMNETQVYRVRKRLGLKAHDLGGTVNWPEGTIERVSEASKAFWASDRPKPSHKGQRRGLLEPHREKHGWK